MHWRCCYCGSDIPSQAPACPACGQRRSRLAYAHLCGVIGGLIGSLAGFTIYDVAGALAGGFAGIVFFEFAARLALRPRRRIS